MLYFDFGLEDVFLSLDSRMVHKSTGSMDPQMENQEMWLEEERVDEKELSTESLYVINRLPYNLKIIMLVFFRFLVFCKILTLV